MSVFADTIYALATAPGRAGVAIVRVSGGEARSAVTRLTWAATGKDKIRFYLDRQFNGEDYNGFNTLPTTTPEASTDAYGIGWVPQERNIFPSLTVKDNLELGAYSRNDRAGIDDGDRHFRVGDHGAAGVGDGDEQPAALRSGLRARQSGARGDQDRGQDEADEGS